MIKKVLLILSIVILALNIYACGKISVESLKMEYNMQNYINVKGENFKAKQRNYEHDEDEFELYKHQGKVIMLYPIQGGESYKPLQTLYDEYGKNEKDVLVYGYLMPGSKIEYVSWMAERNCHFPLLDAGNALNKLYLVGTAGCPSILVFDKNSFVRVAYEYIGGDYKRYKNAIEYVRKNFDE